MTYWDSIKNIAKELPIKDGNILITGATGLIGSCIIDILTYANESLHSNFHIYAMSRSMEKIKKRFANKVFPVIQDICQPLEMEISYDYIFHAASNADPEIYTTRPAETIFTNVVGIKNVLDYCEIHRNTKLLFMSTFEVYGRIEGKSTYTEDVSGVIDFHRLRNAYPESKRCAELMLLGYVEKYGIDAKIVRLASVYGPTMLKNDSKAHAQFIRKAVAGKDIVLKSKGLQRRTYCYLIDAVSAMFTVLFCGKIGEAYNIANENSIASIAEVAEVCASIAHTHVVFENPTQIESKGFSTPQDCILENKKLKALGWNGKYNLVDGMLETIETIKILEKKLKGNSSTEYS